MPESEGHECTTWLIVLHAAPQAITVFSFPPDKGNVGTAAYLNVFPSIYRVLQVRPRVWRWKIRACCCQGGACMAHRRADSPSQLGSLPAPGLTPPVPAPPCFP